MTAVDVQINSFRDWFCTTALPLWAEQGFDRKRGNFYETLDFNGMPVVNQPRRVRVQARQIYSFSEASRLGWLESGEDLAASGFDQFLTNACPDGGARGCVHRLSDDGEVLDGRRDLYDQAFLLLACAARWRSAKDQRALDLANSTLTFLDQALASPHGGWRESDQGETPRRQNPHMHLFEAFLALHNATGEQHYLTYSKTVFSLFEERFFDGAHNVVIEFFDDRFQPADQYPVIEPGHMFEWVWLLTKYDKAAGADTQKLRARLFQTAIEIGEDPDFFGFASNRVTLGKETQNKNKRLWPQTEYVKACFARIEDGDASAADRAAQLIENLFQSYLKVNTDGLWIDEFDGAGAPIARDVPASIVYHLLEAVVEADRFQQTRNAS